MLSKACGDLGRRLEGNAETDADIVRVKYELQRSTRREVGSGGDDHRWTTKDHRPRVRVGVFHDGSEDPGGDLKGLNQENGAGPFFEREVEPDIGVTVGSTRGKEERGCVHAVDGMIGRSQT